MEIYKTIDEVAQLLRCSTKTVRRYTKEGLVHYRRGGRLLFKQEDIDAFMEQRRER